MGSKTPLYDAHVEAGAQGRSHATAELGQAVPQRGLARQQLAQPAILPPLRLHVLLLVAPVRRDAEFRVAPGGHMGVIIGSKAQGAVWAQSAEWLAARSAE